MIQFVSMGNGHNTVEIQFEICNTILCEYFLHRLENIASRTDVNNVKYSHGKHNKDVLLFAINASEASC